MKKTIGYLSTLLMISIVSLSSLFASGNCGGDKKACGPDQCMQKLNLTQEQKDKMKVLKEGFKTSTETTRNEIKELKNKAKLIKSEGEATRLSEVKLQIEAKANEIKLAHEKLESDIKNLLTEEQKLKLDTMMKSCGNKNKSCGDKKEKGCCKGKEKKDAGTIEMNNG
ncbi:MAG: Spy/CpxP family protein refolding chaperone, partial [Candidatus Kapaibacterium sp.]